MDAFTRKSLILIPLKLKAIVTSSLACFASSEVLITGKTSRRDSRRNAKFLGFAISEPISSRLLWCFLPRRVPLTPFQPILYSSLVGRHVGLDLAATRLVSLVLLSPLLIQLRPVEDRPRDFLRSARPELSGSDYPPLGFFLLSVHHACQLVRTLRPGRSPKGDSQIR